MASVSFAGLQYNQSTTLLMSNAAGIQTRKPEELPEVQEDLSIPASSQPDIAKNYGLYDQSGIRVSQQSFSLNAMEINFQTEDGDRVQFKYAQARYQSTSVDLTSGIQASENEEKTPSIQDVIDKVRNSLFLMQKEVLRGFIEANGGKFQDVELNDSFDEEEVSELESKMPEFWNAENTSQRIVDFATSFFGKFGEGDINEFLETIKGAIENGFQGAIGDMGDLPTAVGGLINKTHKLAMEKLDQWAAGLQEANQTAPEATA